MRGKYVTTLAARESALGGADLVFATSNLMRTLSTPMQPFMDATLGLYNHFPVGLRIEGIRRLASLHPLFNKIASKFPDVVTFQFGTGSDAEFGRDFEEVTLTHNAAKPWRTLDALAYYTKLQNTDHRKADYNDLVKGAKISNEMQGDEEDLLRFEPANGKSKGVKFLVAPRSGHYSTLIAAAIQANIDAGYTVYLNDIHDASYTPLQDTPHGINAQARDKKRAIERIFEIEKIKPDVVAICQGAIPSSIAIAKLCKDKSEAKPNSFAFLSGPGDVSVTESLVSGFGADMSDYFLHNLAISTVPPHLPGAGKRVRAQHDQISNFMMGNPGRHMHDAFNIMNFIAMYGKEFADQDPLTQKQIIAKLDDPDLPDWKRAFLELVLYKTEYFTGASQDAASFEEAIKDNFQANFLATGQATFDGEPVSLDDIDIPTLAVDADKDDISSIGQSLGIFLHMGKNIIKSALTVIGKGHFWWAGETAAKIYWPQIIRWQENPKESNIPRFNEDMIAEAQKIHETNVAADAQKVKEGRPFAVKLDTPMVRIPLAGPLPIAA